MSTSMTPEQLHERRHARVLRWHVKTIHGMRFADDYPTGDTEEELNATPETYTYNGARYPINKEAQKKHEKDLNSVQS